MENQAADSMEGFRVASRELFNHHFRVQSAWENQEHAWLLAERFEGVQRVLFQKMVSEAINVDVAEYGAPQGHVLVIPKFGTTISADVNRDVDSGYWDFPVTVLDSDAVLYFVEFFDWDVLSVRNNEYVRVVIASCTSNPEIAGKHALVRASEVSYRLRE